MKTVQLRCEYFTNPLGIDSRAPRLSWQLLADTPGAKQTAYQIRCESDGQTLWDSGRVASNQNLHVPYAGPALRSRQQVRWQVRAWDAAGVPTELSEPAWFEMGLLNRADWQAEWIGSPVCGGKQTTAPCPYLRTTFQAAKPVARARLYATALGLYEASINGKNVTADVFTPGWPDYRERTLVQSYDVTALILPGPNAIGAILGDGWYCGYVGWEPRQHYGDRPRFFAQLVLTFADGSEQIVATNSRWQTATGPILESDIMVGESYDARRELPGWNTPTFDATGWTAVTVFPDPGIALVGKQGEAVRRVEEILPLGPPSKRNIFDLGQNFTGRVRLKVQGPAGTTITIRFAEILKPDGSLYTENLRGIRCTDFYTLKGGGEEVYEPRFTFHGFRYVELKGYPGAPPTDAVTGVVIHSDMERTGEFECSDKLVNQLFHNIIWGQKSNFLDIPTDCPQRNERLGWTGDAQVFIRTAGQNMNVAPFFTKWLADATISQAENGGIPSVIPTLNPKDADGGPAWADAFIICPWTLYQYYADRRLLETLYPRLQRFVEWMTKASQAGIRRPSEPQFFEGYGDWLAQDGTGITSGGTPKDLIGTAFYAHAAQLLAEISAVTGRTAEAAQYRQLCATVKQAFNRRYVTQDGLIVGQTQTAYVLALHFDLLPAAQQPVVLEALVKDIEKRGWHLSTGFVGTPYLMHVLSRFGKLEVAYKLLFQTTWPSWLYPVTQGATTIWERWDGWTHDKGFQDVGMNSFNHYAYGAVGDWLYAVVAGINIDPAQPAFQRILFRPQPGGGLTSARAKLQSLFGAIVSDWKINGPQFELQVTVPPNTTAAVQLPDGSPAIEVAAGPHRFQCLWKP